MTPLYVAAALIIAGLVVIGRPLWLLLAVLFVVFVPTDAQFGGIRLELDDVAIVGLLVTMLRYPAFFRRGMRHIPYWGLWVTFGLLTSLAYFYAPINASYVTDPFRTLYQTVRYCWRPILLFPLGVMLLAHDEGRRDTAFRAIVLAGVLFSIGATYQGYTDQRVEGPFQGGNALGGALIGPFILAVAGCVYTQTRRQFWLSIAATAIIARGLLFSSSRGAFVGVLAGVALCGCFLLVTTVARRRIIQLVGMGCVAIVLAFAAKPNLLTRPNVAAMFSAAQGTSDSNFQWRLERRWPYFLEQIRNSPWLGVGTDRDLTLSLKMQGNTPHNGYLSLALLHGIPAAAVFLLFAMLTIRNGISVFRHDDVPKHRVQALAVAGVMAGLLVHNIVESTLTQPFVIKIFWFLTAIAAGRWIPATVLERSVAARARAPRRAALQRSQAARPRAA